MSFVFTINQSMKATDCCMCGITFAMTKNYYNDRLEDGNGFYCPAGHEQIFTDSEVQKLEREIKWKDKQLERTQYLLNSAKGMLRYTENSLRSTRGAHTKTKKRIANGVCPCCKRSFRQLARHMHTQHPEFAE